VECRFASRPPPHKTRHDASIVRTNRPNQARHRRQGVSRAASPPARRPSAAASRLGARPERPRAPIDRPAPPTPPAAPHAERTATIDRGGGSARVHAGILFRVASPSIFVALESPRGGISRDGRQQAIQVPTHLRVVGPGGRGRRRRRLGRRSPGRTRRTSRGIRRVALAFTLAPRRRRHRHAESADAEVVRGLARVAGGGGCEDLANGRIESMEPRRLCEQRGRPTQRRERVADVAGDAPATTTIPILTDNARRRRATAKRVVTPPPRRRLPPPRRV
jgi:hypothetical protein